MLRALAPRWSPDGRYVAAMPLNQTMLVLFDFKTGKWSELPSFNRIDNPVWSHDGRLVYFQAESGDLYRVRTSDQAVEKLTGADDVKTSTVSICFFAGLALDDSPLLSCRSAEIDLYALEWKARQPKGPIGVSAGDQGGATPEAGVWNS